MTELRKAATAVVLRDSDGGPEVLLLERSSHGFFGRSWVFPGGAIESGDYEGVAHELVAAQAAAARETFEEAGFALEPDSLLPFAHWTPPEGFPSRFATWFFICCTVDDQLVSVDGHEIINHRWYQPKVALDNHLKGVLPMAPPTVVTLTELTKFDHGTSAVAFYRRRGIAIYQPRLVNHYKGDGLVLYAGDAGFSSGDPAIEGARNRVRVAGGICQYETTLL